MTEARVRRALLRLYPTRWRARYGDELDELMREASSGRRLPWRIWKNVALAGGRERLRASGLVGDALPPGERSRAGTLLVLCSWSLFVVAGVSVQKISEHWQGATPSSSRALPAAALDVLVAAAVVGSAATLLGIACALPALRVLLAAGRRHELRRPIRTGFKRRVSGRAVWKPPSALAAEDSGLPNARRACSGSPKVWRECAQRSDARPQSDPGAPNAARCLQSVLGRAAGLTLVAGLATAGLVSWAHGLSARQRNGHDLLYGLGALAWALLAMACLAAWTAAAVAAGSRVDLSRRLLRVEAWLGAVAATAMVVMLGATCVWWASLARSAPWFFTGAPAGSHASAVSPGLIGCVLLMVAATAAGLAGSLRAVRAR